MTHRGGYVPDWLRELVALPRPGHLDHQRGTLVVVRVGRARLMSLGGVVAILFSGGLYLLLIHWHFTRSVCVAAVAAVLGGSGVGWLWRRLGWLA